jgi:SAM-dependent methyltransferase
MKRPEEYTFTRYLSAKKSVDDRSLNRAVWNGLSTSIQDISKSGPLRIIEIGAGIGTMVERVLEWGLTNQCEYTALDSEDENISEAAHRLPIWARSQGYTVQGDDTRILRLSRGEYEIPVRLETADILQFVRTADKQRVWDLLIANAFLDLMDVPASLPSLLSLLKPGGLFYFTITFDGATIFEPQIDKSLDAQIEALYHETMDARVIGGKLSGDSRTGRHFFQHARDAGIEILAAGPSDWVVFAGSNGYPQDEAYFLHFIVHTVGLALKGHPELNQDRFNAWIEQRHKQVEEGRLVYMAHQLDFLGRVT